MKNEIKSTAHFKYRRQYHKLQKKSHIQRIKSRYSTNHQKIVGRKKSEIIETQTCSDHIHYANQYNTISECSTVDRVKSRFDRHANLKYRYRGRNFWARGYFADTVVRNKKAIKEYIKNQLKEDDVADKSTRTCLWLAEENKARWITTFSGCL